MNLGAFSVSLAVKNLAVSKEVSGKLGFEVVAGAEDQRDPILRNGDHVIGPFQGMFEQNILTFNPGWDRRGHALEGFTDLRELQRTLQEHGVEIYTEADPDTTGPASLVLLDPDGNPILIDPHM